MARRILPLALLVLHACSGGGSPPNGTDVPRGTILRDVVFCSPAATELRMDLYFPTDPSARPTLVFIHGGAWTSGTKEEAEQRWLDLLREPLVAEGFIVASIEHRLSPQFKWPAHGLDAQCAVRFLRAHAAEYGIDAGRIGAWGSSSGAHLAALLGTAADGAFGADAEWSGFSSRVSAVVDLYGPADLTSDDWPAWQVAVFPAVFATGDLNSPVLAAASPTTHVSAGDAAFLVIHGDDDSIVALAQSQALHAALQAAGVSSELLVVSGGQHGLPSPTDPSTAEIVDRIVDFFVGRLQP